MVTLGGCECAGVHLPSASIKSSRLFFVKIANYSRHSFTVFYNQHNRLYLMCLFITKHRQHASVRTDPDTQTCSYPRSDRTTAASKLSPSEGCPDSVVCHPSHASPGEMNAADRREKKTSQREAQSAVAFLVSTGKLHSHPQVLIKQCLEIVYFKELVILEEVGLCGVIFESHF